MRYLLLTIIVLFFYQPAIHGQAIEAGYLVLSSGDTLRGEVENAFWGNPPTSVRFRTTPDAPFAEYKADTLQSIFLSSDRLLRFELLPLDRSAQTNINKLTVRQPSQQTPEYLMADVLTTGAASLLGVSIDEVKHFFVRREDRPYLELAERNYLTTNNGVQSVVDGNDYRNQLRLYFADCPAVVAVIEKSPFTAKALQKVVQTYNIQCSSTRQPGRAMAIDKFQRAKTAFRFGVLTGIRYNSLIFGNSGAVSGLNGLQVDGVAHGQVGGYLDLLNPGRRLGLHVAFLVSRFGNSKAVEFYRDANGVGSFEWHGTIKSLQVGIRGFRPLENQYDVFYGIGYDFNGYSNVVSKITYGGRDYDFLGGFHGFILPYAEFGMTRNRLSVFLNGRIYQREYFASYDYRPWSLSISMAFRLNKNMDESKK